MGADEELAKVRLHEPDRRLPDGADGVEGQIAAWVEARAAAVAQIKAAEDNLAALDERIRTNIVGPRRRARLQSAAVLALAGAGAVHSLFARTLPWLGTGLSALNSLGWPGLLAMGVGTLAVAVAAFAVRRRWRMFYGLWEVAAGVAGVLIAARSSGGLTLGAAFLAGVYVAVRGIDNILQAEAEITTYTTKVEHDASALVAKLEPLIEKQRKRLPEIDATLALLRAELNVQKARKGLADPAACEAT